MKSLVEWTSEVVAQLLPSIPAHVIPRELFNLILQHLSALSLSTFEDRDDVLPLLIETNHIWRHFCERDFKDVTPSHVSSLQRIFDDGRGGEREEGEGWWKCRYWEMHFREELSGVGTLERGKELSQTIAKKSQNFTESVKFCRLQGRVCSSCLSVIKQFDNLEHMELHNVLAQNIPDVTKILELRKPDLKSLSFYFLRMDPTRIPLLFSLPSPSPSSPSSLSSPPPSKKRKITTTFDSLQLFRFVSSPHISPPPLPPLFSPSPLPPSPLPPSPPSPISSLSLFLSLCPNLTRLDIIDCNLTDLSFCTLYHSLFLSPSPPPLLTLTLDNNSLSSSILHIASLLSSPPNPPSLPPPSPHHDPLSIHFEENQHLPTCRSSMPPSNKRGVTLESLSVSTNRINESEWVSLFCPYFSFSEILTSLDVSFNPLQDSAMIAFADALFTAPIRNSLVTFKANFCSLSPVSVSYLCNILSSVVTRIEELFLDGNQMGETYRTGQWISVLRGMKTLRVLSLNQTGFGELSCLGSCFADGLVENGGWVEGGEEGGRRGGGLEELNLGENRMGDGGVLVLLCALLGEVVEEEEGGEEGGTSPLRSSPSPPPLVPTHRPHPTLKKLNLSGNLLTSSTTTSLLSLLKKQYQQRTRTTTESNNEGGRKRRGRRTEGSRGGEGGGGGGKKMWDVLNLKKNAVSVEEGGEGGVLGGLREFVGVVVVDSGHVMGRLICDGVQEI